MRVKLAWLVRVGGGRPPTFTTIAITSKVAVYAPAEWSDTTLTLFYLYQYTGMYRTVLCGGAKSYGHKQTVCDSRIPESETKNLSTEYRYIFYCKRAILFLSSSKILTPHPPLRPSSVLRGEDRLAGRRGGWGVNILEDERNRIALLQ
jgi:hypothetical protein